MPSAPLPCTTSRYDDLRNDRIRPQLRLEQERIGYRSLCAALATTVQDDSRP
nr:Wadjet anti-phage system protein JetD domain-containing protein [Hydrogenophaga sp.]